VAFGETDVRQEKLAELAKERAAAKEIVSTQAPVGINSGWLPQLSLPLATTSFRHIELQPGGVIWLMGWDRNNGDDNVWLSKDDGGSWTKSTVIPNGPGLTNGAAQGDSICIYGTTSGEIMRTADGGATWDTVFAYSPGGWFNGVKFLNGDTVIAHGDADDQGFMVARSVDAGATWTRLLNLPAEELTPGKWFSYYTYRQATDVYNNTMWISNYTGSGTNGRILRTTDAGESWTSWEIALTGGPDYAYYLRTINFKNDSLGFGVSRGLPDGTWRWLQYTTDGGVTWSDTLDLGMPHVENEVYSARPIRGTSVVVAVGENDNTNKPRAWWSTDDGMTYSRLDPSGNNELYHTAFRSATDGWAVGHTQVYKYTPKTLRKVTFTCNTATVPDTIPVAGSTIQIRGGTQGGGFSPITWGNDAQNNMFNVGGDYWSKTVEMQVGDTLRYKFVVAYTSGTGWEQGVAGTFAGEGDNSNRAFVVPDQDTTLEVEFWNNGLSSRPQYFRPYADAPDSIMTVYFRVSMMGPMSSGSFSYDNDVDTVGVRGGGPAGSDLNWSPTYYLMKEAAATNGDGYTINPASMWSAGLQFPKSAVTEGEEFAYKFLIGYDWGRDELQGGAPNRTFTVPIGKKDTTLQWVFFDNERPSERANPDTIAVQFRANLAASISSGGFAIGDTIEVRTGYFGTTAEPGRAKMLQRVAGTTYIVTDTIITKKEDLLDYQYYVVRSGTDQRENYYNFFYSGDVQAEAERRQVMVPASATLASAMIVNDTATSITSARRQPDFPNARPLARDVKVTYEVDIRPAFYQVLQGDTLEDIQGEIDVHAGVIDSILGWGVWMNGLAVGDWGNPGGGDWGLGLRLNDNKKMWDDATNGDVTAGDTTFSRITMIGPDSTQGTQGVVGQVFKFGIYGGDNEGGAGGFGNNHNANVVDTDTVYTLNSQFGSINPAFYDAWDFDLRQPVFPTSVIDPSQPLIYQLAQNYPNPFNPATKIRYSIPQQSYVVLKVYNALGQEVMTLIDGAQKPGIHTVQFDARNLASGIYFYRITAGDFVNVKKMMLLK
jgi:photosystem II stability/assembly factor-like uncharacterized protein